MSIDHISWWPSCIVLSCLNTMSIHRSQYTTRLQHCRSITKKDCEWRDQIIFLHAKLLSKWLKKFLYVIWLKIYFNFNSYYSTSIYFLYTEFYRTMLNMSILQNFLTTIKIWWRWITHWTQRKQRALAHVLQS